MAAYDVFNGDADGICSLVQLRNAEAREAELITGVKRDIELLFQVKAEHGDQITVLDVSLDKNREALQSALAAGAEVFYSDHHFAGDIPESPKLTALINTAADVCTSLLINGHLNGQFAEWAVAGAFGDNLKASAVAAAKPLSLSVDQLTTLENLGIYINYNGYGSNLEDLHFHPADLYRQLAGYHSPFEFIKDNREAFEKLEQGYHSDMSAASAIGPKRASDEAAVFVLPNDAWARRVSGVYSNDLANGSPARAHAVLTHKDNGNFLISVRAPLNNKQGADELCRQFPTGGGRAAAAGINDLPADALGQFIDQFTDFFTRRN
ncbi:MAG: single-stranded DNA-specific DHH superfamily exonuclease [Bermanella sp.]|jgi:single-stranded DNA-specific DHH superfamily exonuclease